MLRQIPNILTVFRLLPIMPFIWYLSEGDYKLALYIYVLAGITDGLDGLLARRFGWQTAIGRILDPLADKLLVLTSFVAMGLLDILPWWLIVLAVGRDLVISIGSALWVALIDRHPKLEPSFISKWNTCFQLLLVTLSLFEQAFFPLTGFLLQGLIMLTATTTIISFIDYVWTWGQKAYYALSNR